MNTILRASAVLVVTLTAGAAALATAHETARSRRNLMAKDESGSPFGCQSNPPGMGRKFRKSGNPFVATDIAAPVVGETPLAGM